MWYSLTVLTVAALLGAALGLVRPVRRGIVPRSSHVIQAQILLAVVGAIIVVVVAESLARAFAVVGAAGLIRYRTRIEDPKDASVMLVALTVGLATGSGLFLFATIGCVFVIGVLWLVESFEPAARTRFDLKVASKQATTLQLEIEAALTQNGDAVGGLTMRCILSRLVRSSWGSSQGSSRRFPREVPTVVLHTRFTRPVAVRF